MLVLVQAQALMKSIKGVQDALAIWMFPMDRERCEQHGQACWRVYRAEAERVDEGQLHVYGETDRTFALMKGQQRAIGATMRRGLFSRTNPTAAAHAAPPPRSV